MHWRAGQATMGHHRSALCRPASYRRAVTELVVLYGEADLRQSSKAAVQQIFVHENYDGRKFFANIALLRLDQPINAVTIEIGDNKEAAPSARPSAPDDIQPGSFVVAGWGAFFEAARVDLLQRHLTVRMIPRQECNKPESYNGRVDEDQICAASIFESVDVCNGFSGAPLMFADQKGIYKAQAIVSWGEGCARPNKPAVFTNLAYYAAWIDSIISHSAASERYTLKQTPAGSFYTDLGGTEG